jgi:hypothetical protein
MDALTLWRNWIAAFDRAVTTDNWIALRPLLADEVTYTVSGVPFACHLVGAEAVLAGLRRSITNFDRHFETREWYGVGVRVFAPDVVTARAMGVYRLGELPRLHFSAPSLWRFAEGRVTMMQDCYDPTEADVAGALGWLAEHAPGLDAGYA